MLDAIDQNNLVAGRWFQHDGDSKALADDPGRCGACLVGSTVRRAMGKKFGLFGGFKITNFINHVIANYAVNHDATKHDFDKSFDDGNYLAALSAKFESMAYVDQWSKNTLTKRQLGTLKKWVMKNIPESFVAKSPVHVEPD